MIYKYSRYNKTPQIQYEGITLVNKRRYTNFSRENCYKYEIKEGDSLDLISHRFLGNSLFWWTIFELNQDVIKDYFNLPIGGIILIPKAEEVEEVIY